MKLEPVDIEALSFGGYLKALRKSRVVTKAGELTKSARGFWGGLTRDGEIVVTTWTDAFRRGKGYKIWRPATDRGGLLSAWREGAIKPGGLVRVIMLRQRRDLRIEKKGREVKDATLLRGLWRIAAMLPKEENPGAIIEPLDR